MKKATISEDKVSLKKQEENEKVVAPSTKTLNFIRLFARTYHIEKKLPLTDNGIYIN